MLGNVNERTNVLENPELAQKANPLNYLGANKDIPTILMMHGSQDFLVPFNQSVRLYEKLRELDKELFSGTLKQMPEAELDEHLGCEKNMDLTISQLSVIMGQLQIFFEDRLSPTAPRISCAIRRLHIQRTRSNPDRR
jgi:hypothetical protein